MHGQELGDYLGVESCTDFTSDVAAIVASHGGAMGRCRHSRRIGAAAAAAEFPPPISRAEKLVLKKYRTSDGRLVITGERAPRHPYFQVQRSDGRLLLNLIPTDAAAEEEEERREGGGGGEEKLGFPRNVADSGEKIGGDMKIVAPLLEGVYIGVESCGGFGVAMAGIGMRPSVRI